MCLGSFEPRLHFYGLSYLPTAVSVLSWGPGGVQLMDNHFRLPSHNKAASYYNCGNHLVAHSKDRTRIATPARQGDSAVTVLDLFSNAPK